MLAKIRQSANNVVVKIILILIALSFVGIGGASFIGGNSQGDIVSFDRTESISFEEFQFAKAREIDLLQRQNGITLTDEQIAELNIDHNILQKLINSAMIKYLAKEYDFAVSEDKVVAYIKQLPYFQNEDGIFDAGAFKSVFNNSPKREEEYVQALRDEIAMSFVTNLFVNSLNPSEEMKSNMTNYMAETRSADIVSINLEHQPKNYQKPEVTKEQIVEFYEKNHDLMLVPEERSFSYIVIDDEYFKKHLKISEQELKDYFENNSDEFPSDKFSEVKDQVKEAVTQEKMEKLTNELAKNLEEDVSRGNDIFEISKKYNVGIKKQTEPISIEEMNRSENKIYPEISDYVFDLIRSETSYPIEIQDQNSIVLVYLDFASPARKKMIQELDVEEEIIDTINRQSLIMHNIKTINELRKDYDPAKAMSKAEKEDKGLQIVKNQKFTRAELPMNTKLPPELLAAIFETSLKNATKIVKGSDNKIYFAYVNSSMHNVAQAKKIKEASEEHFSNVIKEGIFQELISYLIRVNNMKISSKL